MNSINLTGRLTADPELKQTQTGKSVCSFCIAVKRPNVRNTTDFINCVAWEKTAEFVSRYFSKGKAIEVGGCLTSRKWEDGNGNKRTAFEVLCDRCEFGESKSESENVSKTEQITTNTDQSVSYFDESTAHFEEIGPDDDLPF